jgi:putative methyltransferase (TIGR04325 family)
MSYWKQRLRYLLILCIPPIVVKEIIWIWSVCRQPRMSEWEVAPHGWDSSEFSARGWNTKAVADSQLSKWPAFKAACEGPGPLGINHEAPAITNQDFFVHNTIMTFAYVISLVAGANKTISILDWGGGVGHYYVLARALRPDLRISYHCKELPVIAECGRKLVQDIVFYDDDDSCLERRYDLIVLSGALHYHRDWKRVLAELAKKAAYLYVTRMPLVERSDSFVALQRPYGCGYDSEWLCWCLNRAELFFVVKTCGLELIREFLLHERPRISEAPEQPLYRGFLFRSVGALSKDYVALAGGV